MMIKILLTIIFLLLVIVNARYIRCTTACSREDAYIATKKSCDKKGLLMKQCIMQGKEFCDVGDDNGNFHDMVSRCRNFYSKHDCGGKVIDNYEECGSLFIYQN